MILQLTFSEEEDSKFLVKLQQGICLEKLGNNVSITILKQQEWNVTSHNL